MNNSNKEILHEQINVVAEKVLKGTINNIWDCITIKCDNESLGGTSLIETLETFLSKHLDHEVEIKISVFEKHKEQDVYVDEPTVNFTLKQISDSNAWENFVDWKGWDYYVGHRISAMGDWNERQEIPISLAKKWGLI